MIATIMTSKFNPHPYQKETLDWLMNLTVVDDKPGGMLFLEPGLGKTVTTLTWFQNLHDFGLAKQLLVVAPIRVRDNVWPQEPKVWKHLTNMSVAVLGSGKWKAKGDEDILVVNPDSLNKFIKWAKENKVKPDALIVDESGDFRSWSSTRTKAIRKVAPKCKYRLCLTATPVPESAVDVFPQAWIIDGGERLGKNITQFRSKFCYRGGYEGKEWLLHKGAAEEIATSISDISLVGSVEGNLELPELGEEIHKIPVDNWIRLIYKDLDKKDSIVLGERENVPKNAAGKRMMLRQLCNGSVYDSDKEVYHIHDDKLDYLVDLVASRVGPVLLAYQFDHDIDSIQSVLDVETIRGGDSSTKVMKLIDQWNRSEVPVLAVQPQALSHGVNMQKGTCQDIIWYGLSESLLVFQQLNTRVWRQGVKNPVKIHQLVLDKTVDTVMIKSLDRKQLAQADFLKLLPKVGN